MIAGGVAAQFPAAEFYCPPTKVIAQEAARDVLGHCNVPHLETDTRADVYLAGNDALGVAAQWQEMSNLGD